MISQTLGHYEIIEKIAFGAATIGNDFHHSPAQPSREKWTRTPGGGGWSDF